MSMTTNRYITTCIPVRAHIELEEECPPPPPLEHFSSIDCKCLIPLIAPADQLDPETVAVLSVI